MSGDFIHGAGLDGSVYVLPEDSEHIHNVRLSPDGLFLACVFGNGTLRVLNTAGQDTAAKSGPGAQYKDLPSTGVAWLPLTAASATPTGSGERIYQLVSVSSAGGVFGWSFNGTTLERFAVADEPNNEIASVDVSPDGQNFITAGTDRTIRMYRTADFTLIASFTHGVDPSGAPRTAHANRIFSARYVTPTLVVSAGWDSLVQLWDIRTGRAYAQVENTQPCSDGVEPFDSATALFVATSGNAPTDAPQVVIARGSDGMVLANESSVLCSQLSKSVYRAIVSRIDPERGLLWCLSLTPHTLTLVSVSTGTVLGSLPLPSVPMNMCVVRGAGESQPPTAYVACQGSTLVVVQCKTN